ncbi:cation-transporting ATPase [Microbacterium sp. Marseille-Q6965]|uniref:cation-transporting ATPase n=1 Tax=Microbacterium sp. Marseille-Q6965 TaxID=2965072 RepID=UPI0021B773CB|nr:cation-transporting ATPase [Microbacterium sp. Marseille-Q6965]
MSKLSRFIGMASKAIDKAASSSAAPSSGSPTNGRASGADWRSVVRTIADTVTGDAGSARPDDPAAGATSSNPHRSHRSGREQAVPSAPAGFRHGLVPPPAGATDDGRAVARYQYLLRTAEPHQVEQIHREAFERLTPAQRAELEAAMRSELDPAEQPRTAAPADLARAATRAEVRRPGRLAGLLARAGRGGRARGAASGLAGAGGLLAAVAGGAVATAAGGQLIEQALAGGIDVDALASGVDLQGLAEGVGADVDVAGMTEGIGDVAAGAGEHLNGLGDQVSGWGEHLSNLRIPGIDDLFRP